ncbi:Protein RST1 [Camellia lanceoleosa]|uniref:Protein RST1 n=1 Tax=Camellia lanceoleosa TaxID=1840588 RepID=A0ACC0IYB0_9ERIC|nr:Protein RST1 [Camellia lanceoleosa]
MLYPMEAIKRQASKQREQVAKQQQVSSCSRSTLVKGACGVGLGFSCQDLLTWVEASDDSDLEKETYDTDSYVTYESLAKNYNDLKEDIWGIVGLVLSLGSSIGATYRSGAHDVVQKIKAFFLSWIPHLNHSVQNSLAMKRVELMYDNELDQLVSGFRVLISELVSIRKSGISHQSLLMASCVEARSLITCILNEGVHSLKVEVVKDLLALFQKSYSKPHPHLTQFGGMLGVVNALGTGARTLVPNYPLKTLHTTYDQKDSFYIMGPLLSCPILESQLTSLVQEIHYLWFRELQNTDSSFPSNAASQKSVSQNFPKGNVVMELSLWLMHLNYPGAGAISHVYIVATVLHCLSQAPKLLALDWGVIIRRCMKYEDQIAESLSPDLAFKSGILMEECLQLSLPHANQFDPLLSFLNELFDLYLVKIFSASRLEKLFDDVANFLSSLLSGEVCTVEQKSLLRVSCWNGLYLLCIKHGFCMEVLFSSLSILHSDIIPGIEQVHSVEWSVAVKCLAKARQGWLFTQKARLVQIGSIPSSELGKLKYKKQWLLDAVKISCVTIYPSTALRFVGMLCGSYSKYMPLLVMDQHTVLSDLPAMKLLSELIELNRDVSASGNVFQSLIQCTNECNWNPVTFDMLVKAYVKMGMIKEGLRSFRKIVKLGYVPHVVVFNSLLDGLLKSNYTD